MDNKRTAVAGLVISAAALVSIAINEGYTSSVVIPVKGDRPTWGFGDTETVQIGKTTTPPRALVQLEKSANEHAKGMAKCINVPISQNEYDAYLSFTYNVGVGAFCKSNVARDLNAGRYEQACKDLLQWDHAGGVRYPGLTKRRQEESAKCLE